tara:strand:+ start:4580 stop:5581 length:1002 start_codon:yes stop_codon:yes gene_type:complete
MKIRITKVLEEKKKKRKKRKKSRKKRTPRAAYWWGYGGSYGDYGDAGGDGGGGGDGKRDDERKIKIKIVKNLKEKKKKDPVSKEISKLMDKGMEQDQAVAIALSMDEKGKLKERCQKGYKTHPTRKTKEMFGKTYRNCVKAENKENDEFDLKLPRGKEVILKAEDENYSRGLVVKLLDDGGYDVYYWYNDPSKIYPAEIKVDNKIVKKDGKLVHIGFHPELEKEAKEPAKGTGKKPKGSGRRLYTDEDPSDTVSVKFSTVQDIKDTLSKASFKSKSHKRQSQIINLIHQRVRAAYENAKDPKVKARLKRAFEYAKKRKEASKEKTIRMRKEKK